MVHVYVAFCCRVHDGLFCLLGYRFSLLKNTKKTSKLWTGNSLTKLSRSRHVSSLLGAAVSLLCAYGASSINFSHFSPTTICCCCCVLNILRYFIEYTLLRGSVCGQEFSPVAENGFRAFQRAKLSPQDMQLNTYSSISFHRSN